MITAVDTNVLLDILLLDSRFCDASSSALVASATAGSLVICDLVYAELAVHFEDQRTCDEFLDDTEIQVEPLTREACFDASRAWRAYRRRGGRRTRILADFLIGSHAQVQASRLLSRDRGFYHAAFPSLEILDPSRRTLHGS
jgi:predicted nucleic acid-binding protein